MQLLQLSAITRLLMMVSTILKQIFSQLAKNVETLFDSSLLALERRGEEQRKTLLYYQNEKDLHIWKAIPKI